MDAPDFKLDPDKVFDSAARLQLLQLESRRQVAERLRKDLPADVDEGDDQEEGAVEAMPTAIPDRWRLVPEGITLHAWQQDCLPKWLVDGRGTVKVATGGGKTLFALAAAQELQNTKVPDLRLVIVVPTIPLMVQWKADLIRSNIPESAIAFMGGGKQPGILATTRILVCVLNSARDRLPDLVRKAGWPDHMLLVVDECHRTKAEQSRRIFKSEPRYTLGLSATPESADDDETLPAADAYNTSEVGQSLGPIIYELSLQEAHAAGLLSSFEVNHVGIELLPDERHRYESLSREISELHKDLKRKYTASRSRQPFLGWCKTVATRSDNADAQRFISMANQRKRLLYRAKSRAAAVLGILRESMTQEDARAIVFHEQTAEVDALFLAALDIGLPAVLEHSKQPDGLRAESIEAFRDGTARVIVSAKSLVEGFNVPAADVGIIAASNSSVRQRIQSLGRMLRRKQGSRTAVVYVLYVRASEDEAIYEKADWESLVGAERNRYFWWRPTTESQVWNEGLEEVDEPPRSYRPPSTAIDITDMLPGDSYLAQTKGTELKVDQAGNLRLSDDSLVAAPRELVDRILELNRYRRAVRTPAGHVIARCDNVPEGESNWRFVGVLNELPESSGKKLRFRLISQSGKRQIIRDSDAKAKAQPYARTAETATARESGKARDTLIAWITEIEHDGTGRVTDLYWDGQQTYWIEVAGKRIDHPGPLAGLEFRS